MSSALCRSMSCGGGVPVRIDVFRIDGAVRQIPGAVQVGVGGPQVELDRLVWIVVPQRCAAKRLQLIDVVIRRVEPIRLGRPQSTDEPVDLRTRTLTRCPDELITVLLVEPLFFPPEVMAALAIGGGKYRRFRFERCPQRRARVWRRRRCPRTRAL